MNMRTKIAGLGSALVAGTGLALAVLVVVQRASLARELKPLLRQQAEDAAAAFLQSVQEQCENAQRQVQDRLMHSLKVAEDALQKAGGFRLDGETVAWQAVNQFTKETRSVVLPKAYVGATWLSPTLGIDQHAPVVDDVKYYTRDAATVFQQMNEEGDLLRVTTSVLHTDGRRAIGTYIPHRNPDGSPNAVVSAILKGEDYRGRAFVVNQWYDTLYRPLWDESHRRIVGVLFVGTTIETVKEQIQQSLRRIRYGKSGRVFILGASGDQKGKYVLSPDGARDGASVWDVRDAEGHYPFRELIERAAGGAAGERVFAEFQPTGDSSDAGEAMFVAATYFAPYEWVIGLQVPHAELEAASQAATGALGTMLGRVLAGTVVLIGLGMGVSLWLARGLARPVGRVAAELAETGRMLNSSARHLAETSQALAQGTTTQAASLEETSASLEEMTAMTQRNAAHAQQARELAGRTRTTAEGCMVEMRQMQVAMAEIDESSQQVARILKTIDEIAFQTNLLALNAAVEAARAGEAGMGFAVVADEVRALAQRAAAAARETSERIETSMERSRRGVAVSRKVAQSLEEVVSCARQVDELVAEIAAASQEQSRGIGQISSAVGQMDKITQSNAAAAEENAATAQELSAQAELLRRAVADLEAMIGVKTATEASEPRLAGPAGNGVGQTQHAGSAHDGGSRSSFTHGNGKHPGRLGGRPGSSAPDVPGTPIRA